MDKAQQEKILEGAKAVGQKYLDAFNTTGNYDLAAIAKALEGRTFEGKPVVIDVVATPDEAVEVLKRRIKESGATGLEPWNCIWSYYEMAFFNAVYSQLPDQTDEFARQSFFEAYKAGLGFYINLGGYAVAIARPEAYLDQNVPPRLHREDGPAKIWGSSIEYFWHGTPVEKDWIEKRDTLDPADFTKIRNEEQRRAFCEIVGWDKILERLKVKTLQKDAYGELLETNLPGAEKERFVRVECPTGRTFCLPVSNSAPTAHAAIAELHGLTVEEYHPRFRT